MRFASSARGLMRLHKSICLALMIWAWPWARPQAQERDPQAELTMWEAIQALRKSGGVEPLERNPILDRIALEHTLEMAQSGTLTHVSPQTGTPMDRVKRAGLNPQSVAENVARHSTVAEAQAALESSEKHRANMLDSRMNQGGVAVIRSGPVFYVTQIFAALPKPSPPPAPPHPPSSTPPAPSDSSSPSPFLPEAWSSSPSPSAPPQPSPSAQQMDTAPPPTPAEPQLPIAQPGQVVVTPSSYPYGGGFWVCSDGRWWYYPWPQATSGVLVPDPRIQGAPPGFGGCAPGHAGPLAIGPELVQALGPVRAYRHHRPHRLRPRHHRGSVGEILFWP
ncbi:MAG: CAP domain-containing protein [Deltaproteobacteria bacterium]|nr:CAP domain-containing protein [Deltaproteobacteria bacterium]